MKITNFAILNSVKNGNKKKKNCLKHVHMQQCILYSEASAASIPTILEIICSNLYRVFKK